MSQYPNSYNEQLVTPGRMSMWPTPVFPQADIPALIQDPATGAVFLNPRKQTAKWCYLSSNPYPLTVAANGTLPTSLTPPLDEGSNGDMEIVKFSSTSTGDFAVLLEDTVSQRKFMNQAIPNNMIFGTAQMPFTLFETIWLPATANLIASCTDLSGNSNAIRIVAEGRRFMGCGPRQALWQGFMERRSHAYWMTFDAGSEVQVAANSTQTYNMTVPVAGDFLCWLIMDDSATDYRIRIFEGASGRQLMAGPGEDGTGRLSCQNMVASSTYTVAGFPGNTVRASNIPHAWTFTHLFKRATQIGIEITNTTGAPIDVRLCLHGQLIYYNDCPSLADPERARMLQAAMIPCPAPANWLPCASPGCLPPPEPIPIQQIPVFQNQGYSAAPPAYSQQLPYVPGANQRQQMDITNFMMPGGPPQSNQNVQYDAYGRQIDPGSMWGMR